MKVNLSDHFTYRKLLNFVLPSIVMMVFTSIYGVVDATVQAAAAATKNGKIGAIGTVATIKSSAYEKGLQRILPGVQYRGKACPLFVPLVENGRTEPGDIVIETVAAEYLEEFRQWGADTLILGCTHYPLLDRVIGNYMGSGVALIDAGAATAEYVAGELARMDRLQKDAKTLLDIVSDGSVSPIEREELQKVIQNMDELNEINQNLKVWLEKNGG